MDAFAAATAPLTSTREFIRSIRWTALSAFFEEERLCGLWRETANDFGGGEGDFRSGMEIDSAATPLFVPRMRTVEMPNLRSSLGL
jgi:hypothetical protein